MVQWRQAGGAVQSPMFWALAPSSVNELSSWISQRPSPMGELASVSESLHRCFGEEPKKGETHQHVRPSIFAHERFNWTSRCVLQCVIPDSSGPLSPTCLHVPVCAGTSSSPPEKHRSLPVAAKAVALTSISIYNHCLMMRYMNMGSYVLC